MNLVHELVHPETDKIFRITLSNTKLKTESGKREKPRTTEKDFATPEEALKIATKKEWGKLKKGFVLQNTAANAGEAKLHYFISDGYTGALAFDATDAEVYIYKNGEWSGSSNQKDYLTVLDKNGSLKETIELPKVLAWDIKYNPVTKSFLFDLDHHIYTYDSTEKKFTLLKDRGQSNWASFISVSENNFVYGTDEKLYVTDFQEKTRLEKPYRTEVIKGSTPFCAALSKNGKLIALHNKLNEINLIDTTTGDIVQTITTNFERTSAVQFVENDTVLAIKEFYRQNLSYFDIASSKFVVHEGLKLPEHFDEVYKFCFKADGSQLVLFRANTAYVYDFIKKEFLHSFKINHCIKNAELKFIGDDLGVRTDYGCFSIYTL